MRDCASSNPAASIPKTTKYVAAYINGRFANYRRAIGEFPHVYSVSVGGICRARFYDVENGDYDANSPDLIENIRRDQRDGFESYVYCSLGNWDAVRASLHRAGLLAGQGERYWIAWYQIPPRKTIPRGSLICQYLGNPGNWHGPYDESVMSFYMPGIDPDNGFRHTISRLRNTVRRLRRAKK